MRFDFRLSTFDFRAARRATWLCLLVIAAAAVWLLAGSTPPTTGDPVAWRNWLAEIVNVPVTVMYRPQQMTVTVRGSADANGDGRITLTDVLWVKGCIDSTPAGRPDCWGPIGISEIYGVIGVPYTPQ